MEERVATPVGSEPSVQIVPAADLVHRLVLDQLFEDKRRSSPVNPLQDEEATVKPRCEKVCEIGLDAGPLGLANAILEQTPSHVDQRAGPSRRHVEPPEQFLAWRLDGML